MKIGNQHKAASNRINDLFLKAVSFHQKGTLSEAKKIYELILKLQPNHAYALSNLSIIALQSGSFEAAINLIDKAIAINPQDASFYNNRANASLNLNRLEEALDTYDKAIAINPDHADSYINRGSLLKRLNRVDESLASYDKAIALNPESADAYLNRANTLVELNRLDEAIENYDKALALRPNSPDIYNNRGNTLFHLQRPRDALKSYDQAIALNPNYAKAYNNRSNALLALGKLEEALASCDKAITINPKYVDAYHNRGNVLKELNRTAEALENYDKALTLDPNRTETYNNRGNAFYGLKRFEEAIQNYDKAILLNSHYADAYNNRGNAYLYLKKLDKAIEDYDKALALKPDSEFLLGTFLHTKMKLCDWSKFDFYLESLKKNILAAQKATTPFFVLALFDDPQLHKKAAEIYSSNKYPKPFNLGKIEKPSQNSKIRIGYYSADFHNHATSYLMAGLFEAHDRDTFELFGFSFGSNNADKMHQRVSSAFNKFIDVRNISDKNVAKLSRDLGIDIAIDLKGHTMESRPGIFAEGAAPIQINYLGYPGTMGADYIDYIIADKIVIPETRQKDYIEKVIHLPHCYQANDSKREVSARLFSRQEVGLPESGFVFCCFNNNHKILPETFDLWMKILTKVSGSVLWLYEDTTAAAKNLKKEAEIRGVDSHRLIFAKHQPLADHLARYRLADLFLDTLPYNAHTTASDALWVGVPVLTRMGDSFAARVAASLLHTIGLPELIAQSEEDYIAKAIDLAINRDNLLAIKQKLERNRLTSPLFDTELFTKHIETAYKTIYQRHLAGLGPEYIEIIDTTP